MDELLSPPHCYSPAGVIKKKKKGEILFARDAGSLEVECMHSVSKIGRDCIAEDLECPTSHKLTA